MLQRETNYNLSRSAKRARMASSIPIVALLLVGGMAVSMLCPVGRMVNKAQATDGGVVTLSSYLPSSVTLTLSDKVEGEIEPKANGTFSSISTIARVQVNNSDQYSVLISGEADMTNKAQAANDAKISSVDGATSGTDFKANTWGYNVVEGKNTTAGESAVYSPVGEAKVVSTKLLKDTKGADDYYTLSFGAKVDNTLPAGSYSSTVTLSTVASPKLVVGFDETDTMQGLTASICRNVDAANATHETDIEATDSLGNTYYTKRLKDLRDGKYYWVAKLADGNCWMTQNLALDIPAEGLTSELTALAPGKTSWKPEEGTRVVANMTEEEKLKRFTIEECANLTGDEEIACLNKNADYSWNEGEYVLIYPGEGSRALYKGFTDEQGGLSGWADKAAVLGIAPDAGAPVLTDYGVVMDVSGNEWKVASDPYFTSKTVYTQEGETGTFTKTAGWAVDPVNKVYDAHYIIGNFYEWLAATAQTVEEGQTMTEVGAKVKGSICMKNWELPASGFDYGEVSGSFYNLLSKYASDSLVIPTTSLSVTVGSSSLTIGDMLVSPSLYFVRAGAISSSSDSRYVAHVGAIGSFWSSVASSLTNAHYLYMDADMVSPSHSHVRRMAASVRCLVNTTD